MRGEEGGTGAARASSGQRSGRRLPPPLPPTSAVRRYRWRRSSAPSTGITRWRRRSQGYLPSPSRPPTPAPPPAGAGDSPRRVHDTSIRARPRQSREKEKKNDGARSGGKGGGEGAPRVQYVSHTFLSYHPPLPARFSFLSLVTSLLQPSDCCGRLSALHPLLDPPSLLILTHPPPPPDPCTGGDRPAWGVGLTRAAPRYCRASSRNGRRNTPPPPPPSQRRNRGRGRS